VLVRYLEELVDSLPPRSRDCYEPGVETSIEYDLIPEIISLHKRWSVGDMALDLNLYEILDKFLERKKQEGIELNPQTVLDSLIWRACREDFGISPFLLENLTAAFHRIGYNNFTINVTSLPDDNWMLARSLNGQADRDIRVTYIADFVEDLGGYAHSCRIELFGDAQSAGCNASNSIFIIHGSVKDAGNSAKYCTFVIDDYASIPRGFMFSFTGNSYHLRKGIPDDVVASFKSRGFFEADNHIFTYNEKGNWKEVKP